METKPLVSAHYFRSAGWQGGKKVVEPRGETPYSVRKQVVEPRGETPYSVRKQVVEPRGETPYCIPKEYPKWKRALDKGATC